jgi:hypothetical protein
VKKLIAALDNSPAARPVLDVAAALAPLFDAVVEAVHVGEGDGGTAAAVAEGAGISFRTLDGDTVPALLDSLAGGEVVAGVLGARDSLWGSTPVGSTALSLVELATTPIVVVPPELAVAPWRPDRIVVPLDGTSETADAVRDLLHQLAGARTEILVVHVLDNDTVPRFLDRPARDMEVLGKEFLQRYCRDEGTRFVWRTGPARRAVAEAAEDGRSVFVLAWKGSFAAGHGGVVKDVLSRATVPVILLPAPPRTPGRAPGWS